MSAKVECEHRRNANGGSQSHANGLRELAVLGVSPSNRALLSLGVGEEGPEENAPPAWRRVLSCHVLNMVLKRCDVFVSSHESRKCCTVK